MSGQRLEVGDDQFGLPFIHEVVETEEAVGGLRHRDQIPGNGALVADAVVDVRETEPVDLGDRELRVQILQAAVERGDMNFVALLDQVSEHFFSAGGVPGAFTVYTVEDVSHGEARVYRVGS